jgi:hypothetical protein
MYVAPMCCFLLHLLVLDLHLLVLDPTYSTWHEIGRACIRAASQ